MKKMPVFLLFAVAAMAVSSCAKESAVQTPSKGTPIQIVVGNPEDAVVYGDETKVSWRVARNPKWDAGDAFQLFSHKKAANLLTDWGAFVTEDGSVTSGTSNATFSGYKPEGFTKSEGGDSFTAIAKNASNSSYTLFADGDRYSFNMNIPAVQDGTGLKYSLLGCVPSFDEGSSAFSNCSFNVKSALCALTLPAGVNVKTITITLGYENEENAAGQFLASNGTNQDLKWKATDFTCLGGGGSKTVTITKGGELLPEGTPIYWACIRTQSNSKDYGLAKLTFQFINDADKVATKVANIPSGRNVTVGTKLNNFGTIAITAADFE